MTDNMKKFLELASGDKALAAGLNGASRDEIVALARENGVTLSDADFEAPRNGEIGDDELYAVAGGRGECHYFGDNNSPSKKNGCDCTSSGFGFGFTDDYTYAFECRCTGGGTGQKIKL